MFDNKRVKLFSVRNKVSTNKMATRKQTDPAKDNRSGQLQAVKIWIIGFSILIAITAAVLPYTWIENNQKSHSDLMPIRILEIEGKLNHITRKQITEKIIKMPDSQINLPESGVIGFFDSDLQLMEESLRTIPWIRKVELRRIWPDRLRIKITENKTIARWNSSSLINEFGKIFTPQTITGLQHLPHLKGPDKEVEQLLITYQELQLLLNPLELQLAVLSLNHRYSWSLELTNGIQLQVGRKGLIQRVERFVALYPLLQSESDIPIEKVDLRYDTGLAVTRIETSERQASL